MQPVPTEAVSPPATPADAGAPKRPVLRSLPHGTGPFVGLLLLCIAGVLLNPNFATLDNALNVLTRTAFIGIISVGMCFVIVSGGIDLSVGSMAALIAGCTILMMNAVAASFSSPVLVVALGMVFAMLLGAVFGFAHGLLITKGKIEPFIVTLGTLGIYRAYLTYFSNGGAITLDGNLSTVYSPVYYGGFLGIPIPVWVFLFVASLGAVSVTRLTCLNRPGRPHRAPGCCGSWKPSRRSSSVAPL